MQFGRAITQGYQMQRTETRNCFHVVYTNKVAILKNWILATYEIKVTLYDIFIKTEIQIQWGFKPGVKTDQSQS